MNPDKLIESPGHYFPAITLYGTCHASLGTNRTTNYVKGLFTGVFHTLNYTIYDKMLLVEEPRLHRVCQ